jgi:ubiquinone/menaquinone biosynthesis C-methylase UbiE
LTASDNVYTKTLFAFFSLEKFRDYKIYIGNNKMNKKYVHGYEEKENIRLQDQAMTLVDLLHSDTFFPRGSNVLEAGCGVGAQTVTLAKNSPEAKITSIDISEESVAEAKKRVEKEGFSNVCFQQGDIFNLPFEPKSFDHVFVCFVLEHLEKPVDALTILGTLLKPGGSITVIEGDHGSTYFHPDSPFAKKAIQCQVDLQKQSGGNANIGRELFPLLNDAGFESVRVSPRMVYVDASKPGLVEGFTKKTFTAMIEGIREAAVKANMMEPDEIDKGIRDLYRTTEKDGVFCYTFFKAMAEIR